MKYPIAPNGIFKTIQGEGQLLGIPMAFVRLAGCSVGCAECDTNYTVNERLTVQEIGQRVRQLNCKWYWITGGEPADHDLWPLLQELRSSGHIALATSGTKSLGASGRLVEFLSVSPHSIPDKLILHRGSQINLVPGLNGLKLSDWESFSFHAFSHHYVTPIGAPDGTRTPLIGDSTNNISDCLEWIDKHPEFRLGVQAHKVWGLP